jgi:hypothetical protein
VDLPVQVAPLVFGLLVPLQYFELLHDAHRMATPLVHLEEPTAPSPLVPYLVFLGRKCLCASHYHLHYPYLATACPASDPQSVVDLPLDFVLLEKHFDAVS